MKKVGLFRTTAAVKAVKLAREDVQKVGLVALDNKSDADVVMMASLMKQWLRELRDGIVPKELYDELATASGKLELMKDRKATLIAAIEGLPRINRHTLRYLMDFLYEISQFSEINKMSQMNLAIVFGPCIFKCPSEVDDNIPKASIVEESKNVTDFVMLLFEYYEKYRGKPDNDQNERVGMIPQSSKESLSSSKLSGSSSSLNMQRESGYASKISNIFSKDGTRKSEARKSKLSSSASVGDGEIRISHYKSNSFADQGDLQSSASKNSMGNILNDVQSIDGLRMEESMARDDSFFINYETPMSMSASPTREDMQDYPMITASNSVNVMSQSTSANFLSASSSINSDLGQSENIHDSPPSRAQPPPPLQKIFETTDDDSLISPQLSIDSSIDLGLKSQTKLPSRQQTIIPQKNQAKLIIKDEMHAKRSSTGTNQQIGMRSNTHSKELVNMFKSKRYSVEVGNLKALQKAEEWKSPLSSIVGNEEPEVGLSRSQTLNKKVANNQPVLKPGEFSPQQQKLLANLSDINLDDITPENLEDVKYMFKTLYNKLYVNLDNVVAENSKQDMDTYNKLKYIIKSIPNLILDWKRVHVGSVKNINESGANVITDEVRQEFVTLKNRILDMKQSFEQRRLENDNYMSPQEKSDMKFLYKRYLVLKDRIESTMDSPKQLQLQQLQSKKRELQKKLYEYQNSFKIANGHQVRGAEDMGPLKQEYHEYKVKSH